MTSPSCSSLRAIFDRSENLEILTGTKATPPVPSFPDRPNLTPIDGNMSK
ncbi:MAG: hypothetical protein AB7I09_19000 [Planctomycetota bacterium]